jgi:DNA invertase Pin-like site-specific DNA recombinase
MRVAIYARVSTSDRDQDPEPQLMPLRDFCLAQGWEVYREYVDQAPANGLLHRVQWRQLLDAHARACPEPGRREFQDRNS